MRSIYGYIGQAELFLCVQACGQYALNALGGRGLGTMPRSSTRGSSWGLGSKGLGSRPRGRSRGRAVMTTGVMKTHFAVITDLVGPTLITS